MKRIKTYIQDELRPFDRTALWSPHILREGATIALWWALPAIIMVWVVARYRQRVPSYYLTAAISEGIGPHLWDVVGTLGLVLVGLAILFPRCKIVATSAHQVLVNTYAIGGLSFGLLVGQLTVAIPAAFANVATWKVWLMGTGALLLVVQLFLLNFSLWYLGHLMASSNDENGFLHRMSQVAFRLRVAAFTVISVLPVTLLFLEK